MKRHLQYAAAIALAAALAACGGSKAPSQGQQQEPETQEANNNQETQEPGAGQTSQDIENSPEALEKEFDCGKCPFSIKAGGISKEYRFRNASTLFSWSYSEQNTDGWYYHNGRLISKDGKYAIGPEAEAFSSYCEYEAQPYDGPTLSAEEQARDQQGAVYQKQSFLPLFITRVQTRGGNSSGNIEEIPMCQLYGFQGQFAPGEEISFYLSCCNFDEKFPMDNARIYIFPHSAGATKQAALSDGIKEKAIAALDFTEPGEEGQPNFEMQAPELEGNSAEELYDIVFTYYNVVAQYIVIKVAKT